MNTILIRRKTADKMLNRVNGIVGHQYCSEAEKITFISPERLKIIPCPAPRTDDTFEGIPFDLPALMQLLDIERKYMEILTFNKNASEENPLIIFCTGSSIENNETLYIMITDKKSDIYTIGATKFNRTDIHLKNAYQLRYLYCA